MPRQPRIDLPGHLYHIIAHGAERQILFKDKLDYNCFIDRWEKVLKESIGGGCFAWALMPNHLHLLIRSGRYGLASMMRQLLTGYAVYFNLRHKRIGHLFQNRYKSILCDTDKYLITLVRYIHLNPLKAKIVKGMKELALYPWTGHGVLSGRSKREWQDVDAVLGIFDSRAGPARKRYAEFIADGVGLKEDFEGGGLIRSSGGMCGAMMKRRDGAMELTDERILGSGGFVEEIHGQVGLDVVGEQGQKNSVSLADIIKKISEKYGVEPELKNARAEVICVAVHKYGMKQSTVSKEIGITYSGVSRVLHRTKGISDSILRAFEKMV